MHKNLCKSDLEIFCKVLIIIVLSHGGERFHEEGWKNEIIFHLKFNYFIKSGLIFGPFMNDLWTVTTGFINDKRC